MGPWKDFVSGFFHARGNPEGKMGKVTSHALVSFCYQRCFAGGVFRVQNLQWSGVWNYRTLPVLEFVNNTIVARELLQGPSDRDTRSWLHLRRSSRTKPCITGGQTFGATGSARHGARLNSNYRTFREIPSLRLLYVIKVSLTYDWRVSVGGVNKYPVRS